MEQTSFADSERSRDIALELAIRYSEDVALPARHRPGYTGKGRVRAEAAIEEAFQAKVDAYHAAITHMLGHLDSDLAWRVIESAPMSGGDYATVTECRDFLRMNDYLVLRRDIEHCCPEELGCLCNLLGTLQSAIPLKAAGPTL